MRVKYLIFFTIISLSSKAQELYVFTEPASNMATKSIGLRLNNYLMNDTYSPSVNYHLIPEIMLGVSKKIMVHGDVFFSSNDKTFKAEGASFYGKYRFLSHDDVQKHFRMAAYARVSLNNSRIQQEEINLYGYNSGWETGIIATQLLHKVALSSGISFNKAIDNARNKFMYGDKNSKAVNYTLSIGKLLLPKEYKNYKQTNLNLMLESLNQYNPGLGKYYFDIAPSMQLIFNSVSRLDIGYRKQISGNLLRTSTEGVFIRLEYNFFNVY